MTKKILFPLTQVVDSESWIHDVGKKYLFLDDQAQNELFNHLISLSGPKQLHHLSTKLDILLKRDFIRFLPYDLCAYLLRFLDAGSCVYTVCIRCYSFSRGVS